MELHDTTPEILEVTGDRDEFFSRLEPGDVLLFQGADFLAGLAQLTERRTCYHSALYLGEHPRGASAEHLLAHNVSNLWWGDTATRLAEGYTLKPARDEHGRLTDLGGFIDDLAEHLAAAYLRPWTAATTGAVSGPPSTLVTLGGVGIVTIEDYLDRHGPEWLYGRNPEDESDPAVIGSRSVHHIRSVAALRHQRLHQGDADERDKLRSDLLDAVLPVAADATSFNPAELVSFIPDIMDRPGYREWGRLRKLADQRKVPLAWLLGIRLIGAHGLKSAREIVRERLRSIDLLTFPDHAGGPGWICASFVEQVYAAANLQLDLDKVDEVLLGADQLPLSTPRDLWDCERLVPVTLWARGPERWAPKAVKTQAGHRRTTPGDGDVVSTASVAVAPFGADAPEVLSIGPGRWVPTATAPPTRRSVDAFAMEMSDALWASRTSPTWVGDGETDGDDGEDGPGRRGDPPGLTDIIAGVAEAIGRAPIEFTRSLFAGRTDTAGEEGLEPEDDGPVVGA
ncbi:MAG: hypothetical protein JNK12_22310 [Acidimicrobiales bacterium]|nr:hypothetical protein [Acidimicrobiales bacterium]